MSWNVLLLLGGIKASSSYFFGGFNEMSDNRAKGHLRVTILFQEPTVRIVADVHFPEARRTKNGRLGGIDG